MSYHPEIWDMVWCAYPESASLPFTPGSPRPALVLHVEQSIDSDETIVTVAYCTTNLSYSAMHSISIFAHDAFELRQAGLQRDTKIDLCRMVRLPFTPNFFPNSPRTGDPAIGCLCESVKRRAKDELKEIKQSKNPVVMILDGSSRKVKNPSANKSHFIRRTH